MTERENALAVLGEMRYTNNVYKVCILHSSQPIKARQWLEQQGDSAMRSAMVRVTQDTHALLRAISERTGATMQSVLEEVVRERHKALFWEETIAAFESLKADKEAWSDMVAEREAWDQTLVDGVEE